ncbi:hypothetical protein GF318_02785 [Candidatus Micrarchaeota archaeon]|nr:hypothetical protein [Candidatus Micrarchaeota archaeon]
MVLTQLVVLLIGLGVVSFFSERAVLCSTQLAKRLKVPPLVIGVILISVGTDIPEIANSIFSSYANHGDINVGDTLGSCLTQITLVFGLAVLLGGSAIAHRKNILILGACAIAAVALAALVVLDGHLTRSDALLLILSYIILIAVSAKFTIKEIGYAKEPDLFCPKEEGYLLTTLSLVLSLIFVVVGAVLVIESAIEISTSLKLPEFFISFFVIGIGTSLPELSVELAALRQKQYGILLGDLMGSNITDATLALGIGPLLFPTIISGEVIIPFAFYVVFATLVTVALFAWREKMDRHSAIVLIAVYLSSLMLT